MVCCGLCWCCEDGISFSDLITEPPTTEEVQRFMEMLQGKADPDGDDDTCVSACPSPFNTFHWNPLLLSRLHTRLPLVGLACVICGAEEPMLARGLVGSLVAVL